MSVFKGVYIVDENMYKNITEEFIYDTISELDETCQFSEETSEVLHLYRKEKKSNV